MVQGLLFSHGNRYGLRTLTRPRKGSVLLFVSLCFLSLSSAAQLPEKPPGPVDLRCEYLIDPLGVDEEAPRLLWKLSDHRRGARQTAYEIFVGTDSNFLGKQGIHLWHSGKITSSASLVSYAGKKLSNTTRYYWTVKLWGKDGLPYKAQPMAYFETGIGKNAYWKGAWISDGAGTDVKPAPYFRTTFETRKKVRSARAYIAAAGLYELYINGTRAGDHRLAPAYTRFDRRTLYLTYDVTGSLQQGRNAIGVVLGNGWYNHQSTAVWDFHRAPWRARPVFCMDLHITYEDGSKETISTGKNWKTSTGAITFNSIYTAEHFDASRDLRGWSTATYDDKGWKDIFYRAAPSQNVVSQQMHPIRNTEEIKTRSMQRFSDSLYVFHLGRNIAGVSRLTVTGAAGTTLRLKHGERLYPNGRVDLSNIDVHYRPTGTDDPFQTDIITLAGRGEESFMPHFNYKGFQYVEVSSSAPVTLTSENLVGYFMHSDVPAVGNIQSSDPVINGIWTAANNSYLSNLHGYPTDCPQREKNGWTGDAHIAVETGLYNFDAITVYEKWMADHRDEQQPNGVLPSIIPTGGWGYEWGNGPDWTSTIALIPWNVYLFYGDTKLLAACYDNIRRYVDHINDLYPSGLTSWGLGDWVPVKSKSPVEFTSSGYYLTDVRILAKAAKLLKQEADFSKYTQLAQKIQDAINAKYLNRTTGLYGNGTQTEM
ncbi:MAG: family 78 glycoside hydrolase catalytic domain, partial [Chitinophagaceae bacterium]